MMNKKILVVAAHPDDEVLGCGGAIYRWAQDGAEVSVLILADGESSRKQQDESGQNNLISMREKMAKEAGEILGASSVKLVGFPDNRMDSVDLLDIVKNIEMEIDRIKPEIVLTHHAGDVNIDHRITHDAVITACRPQPGHCVKQMAFFEVLSSTEWRPSASDMHFCPNWFVDIEEALDKKIEALKVYESELRLFPHSRSIDGVEYLAKFRGISAGLCAAESFMLGRLIT